MLEPVSSCARASESVDISNQARDGRDRGFVFDLNPNDCMRAKFLPSTTPHPPPPTAPSRMDTPPGPHQSPQENPNFIDPAEPQVFIDVDGEPLNVNATLSLVKSDFKKQIGGGGWSNVYEGVYRRTRQPAALKIFVYDLWEGEGDEVVPAVTAAGNEIDLHRKVWESVTPGSESFVLPFLDDLLEEHYACKLTAIGSGRLAVTDSSVPRHHYTAYGWNSGRRREGILSRRWNAQRNFVTAFLPSSNRSYCTCWHPKSVLPIANVAFHPNHPVRPPTRLE